MSNRFNLTEDDIARSTRQAMRLEKADNARLECLLHSQHMSIATKKILVSSEVFEEYVAVDTVDAMWDDPEVAQPLQGQSALDGAETLVEAASQLREYADYLDHLHAEGFELQEPVTNDWGWAIHAEKADELEEQVRQDLLLSYEIEDDKNDSVDIDATVATMQNRFERMGLPTPMTGGFIP